MQCFSSLFPPTLVIMSERWPWPIIAPSALNWHIASNCEKPVWANGCTLFTLGAGGMRSTAQHCSEMQWDAVRCTTMQSLEKRPCCKLVEKDNYWVCAYWIVFFVRNFGNNKCIIWGIFYFSPAIKHVPWFPPLWHLGLCTVPTASHVLL